VSEDWKPRNEVPERLLASRGLSRPYESVEPEDQRLLKTLSLELDLVQWSLSFCLRHPLRHPCRCPARREPFGTEVSALKQEVNLFQPLEGSRGESNPGPVEPPDIYKRPGFDELSTGSGFSPRMACWHAIWTTFISTRKPVARDYVPFEGYGERKSVQD